MRAAYRLEDREDSVLWRRARTLVKALSSGCHHIIMARDLDEKDLQILKKLVPELEDLLQQGIDIEYRNILPPVANHHSQDKKDFETRLKRLSAEEMRYLADLVLAGAEDTGCLYPEFAEAFFTLAGQRLSGEVADQLREAYESGGECAG